MIDIITKLKDKKIFKIDSLIEAEVTKSFMGSPVNKKITLRVKYLFDTYCLADEEKSLDYKVPMRKIKYEKIKLKHFLIDFYYRF